MEICPYHGIQPASETMPVRNEIEERYVDKAGRLRTYRAPKLEIFRLFCPACRSEAEDAGGYGTRFGRGIAAETPSAAKRKWNRACADEKLKLFKKAVATGS